MLVLSRKRNEQVTIGLDVLVTVVEIRGSSVRLGFEVPRPIPVHRREVAERILRQGSIRFVDRHLDIPADPFPPGLRPD